MFNFKKTAHALAIASLTMAFCAHAATDPKYDTTVTQAQVDSAKLDGGAVGGSLGAQGSVSVDATGKIAPTTKDANGNPISTEQRGAASGANSQVLSNELLGGGDVTRSGDMENGGVGLGTKGSATMPCTVTGAIASGGNIGSIHGLSVRLSTCNLPTSVFVEVCDASLAGGLCETFHPVTRALLSSSFAGATLNVGGGMGVVSATGQSMGVLTLTSCDSVKKTCLIEFAGKDNVSMGGGSVSGTSSARAGAYGDSSKNALNGLYGTAGYVNEFDNQGPATRDCVNQIDSDVASIGEGKTCDPSITNQYNGSLSAEFSASTNRSGTCEDSLVCKRNATVSTSAQKECVRQMPITGLRCQMTVPTGESRMMRLKKTVPCTRRLWNQTVYSKVVDSWTTCPPVDPQAPPPGPNDPPACQSKPIYRWDVIYNGSWAQGCELQEAALK